MTLHLPRVVCALSLLIVMAAPAAAQSTREEWLALRTRKQARHHRLPGPATQPGAFTITVIRFFSDPAGNLVGVGEARNDTSFDLSYSRINFRFLAANGAELGREWTYLHGGITAHINANNANETLLVPGATGFFKIWTTIPAAAMTSYTTESAGEMLPFAEPHASPRGGLSGSRPEQWAPLVYITGHKQPISGGRISGLVWNDDPWHPNCPCGHPSVFTSSLQVSMAAYHDGEITDVQSVMVAGRHRTARCTEPQVTGIFLHETAAFALEFSRSADSIGRHSVEWLENEPPAAVSPTTFFFIDDPEGGTESFTVAPWCDAAPVVSAPWIRVTESGPTGPDSGQVTFRVERNTGTIREATITLRGEVIRVAQTFACPERSHTRALGAGRVTDLFVAVTGDHCVAGSPRFSNADWLRLGGPPNELRVSTEPNFTGSTRTAIVTLGKETFTFRQAAASRGLDFNGDGSLDLLWYHRDGWVAAWQMNGLQLAAGMLLSMNRASDSNWAPAAAADLDRNGSTDVVWRNPRSGEMAIWRLAGTDVVSTHSLGVWHWPVPLPWRLRAASDFNRDGDPDFVWQDEATGQIALWLMRASPWDPWSWAFPQLLSELPLGPGTVADLNWKIVGSGDFNLDGWPDLVWQHQTDGRIAVWKMQQAAVLETALISPGRVADLEWKIRAVGDMNGDDMPDLIWQHRVDGRAAVWLMNGTTMVAGTVIAQIADTGWEIVGPR